MATAQQPPKSRRRPQDALERLYALWMISTLLIVLAMVALVFILSGQLAAQSARVEGLRQQLARLERSVARLDSEAPSFPAERLVPATPLPPTTASATTVTRRPAPPEPARPASRPSSAATPPAAATPPKPALDDATATALLQAALPDDAPITADLADPAAAGSLLDTALAQAERADWRGRTWTQLALVAHLRGREADAERCLQLAADVGDTGARFYEIAGRRALALGRGADAAQLARRWQIIDRTEPRAPLLLAEASAFLDEIEPAESALADIGDDAALQPADQLRLGRVLIALEKWPALARLLDAYDADDEDLFDERDFQRAVRLFHDGQLTAALSILDYLLESRPGDYDVLSWRGAVLMHANQPQAAADALSAAVERAPRRRDAWCWIGLLHNRLEKWDLARQHLNTAITLSPRFAAAWEALGIVELNAGEPALALERLRKALEIQPRRAAAHFLMALATAKLGDRAAATAALRAALEIDPDLLDQALNAEVLTRLIGMEEIRALAAPAQGSDSPAAGGSAAATAPARDNE